MDPIKAIHVNLKSSMERIWKLGDTYFVFKVQIVEFASIVDECPIKVVSVVSHINERIQFSTVGKELF